MIQTYTGKILLILYLLLSTGMCRNRTQKQTNKQTSKQTKERAVYGLNLQEILSKTVGNKPNIFFFEGTAHYPQLFYLAD